MAEPLAVHRKRKGFTQKTLGDAIDKTPQAIANYETGIRTPRLDTLRDISRVLGVPIDDIQFGSDEISKCEAARMASV